MEITIDELTERSKGLLSLILNEIETGHFQVSEFQWNNQLPGENKLKISFVCSCRDTMKKAG